MIRRIFIGLFLALAWAVSVPAQTTAEFERLFDLLELDEYLQIVSEEGQEDARDIEAEMFAGRGGSAWAALISDIYDPEAIEADFVRIFTEAMDGVDLAPIFAFYDTEQGRRIVLGELRARQGMRDDAVEEAAKTGYDDLVGESDPRRALIDEFVEANDLVERNVTGALNTNFAFLSGMAENDVFARELTQNEIIARVYEQEPEIRASALEWLQAYLFLAFDDLPDEAVGAYIAYSRTPEGKAFNNAIFMGFDSVFDATSYRLGRAAADFVAGQDL